MAKPCQSPLLVAGGNRLATLALTALKLGAPPLRDLEPTVRQPWERCVEIAVWGDVVFLVTFGDPT